MNFNEQKKRIIESGYKHVSLYRGNDRICAWNLAGRIDAKLDEIETRLHNNPPGAYVIKARNSTSEKNPDLFPVITGPEPTNEKQPTQIVYKEPASDKLLENQQILNLTVQVKQLEMENNYLRQQIADLEGEISEIETAAAVNLAEQTPQPSLLESAKEFLGGLMEFGAPLLDQHFALKKQQLEIERMKLAKRQAPGSRPTVKDQNVQIRIIGEWVETFKDQPEIYEALHNISAQSDSVEKYLELLNQFSPDLYEQLSIKI